MAVVGKMIFQAKQKPPEEEICRIIMGGNTAHFIEDTIPLLSADTKAPLKGNVTNVFKHSAPLHPNSKRFTRIQTLSIEELMPGKQ